jgi:AcrR family transcriptional regulator
LARILRATERLLKNQEFDRISMQEIVVAAKTSVGSYYNLFRDKQALLAGLYDRYDEGLDAQIVQWRKAQAGSPTDLVQAAAWVAGYLIDTFRGRRHLLRALALFVRSHPEEQTAARKDRRASQHRFLIDALLDQRREFRHPEPEHAAQAAVFAAASIARERILFSEGAHASATEVTDSQLMQDLVRMLVGFLRPVRDHSFPTI